MTDYTLLFGVETDVNVFDKTLRVRCDLKVFYSFDTRMVHVTEGLYEPEKYNVSITDVSTTNIYILDKGGPHPIDVFVEAEEFDDLDAFDLENAIDDYIEFNIDKIVDTNTL